MREFKFRSWHSRYCEMTYFDGFSHHFPDSIPDGCMMQFTGMKDIEGVDIYEGDIVELHFANKPPDLGCGRYLVSFYRAAFRLEEIEPNWYHPCYEEWLHDYNICKVIGNMWADAHLLLPNKPIRKGGPYE